MTTIATTKIWPDPPLLFREKQSERPGQPVSSPTEEPVSETDKAVLCVACRSVVTGLNSEISIHGAHLHTFFNPAGIVYEVRCFSQATGCVNRGAPTDEFTWFAGYAWEYSFCATCHEHLGWFYNSPGGFFFGLINSKLIVE